MESAKAAAPIVLTGLWRPAPFIGVMSHHSTRTNADMFRAARRFLAAGLALLMLATAPAHAEQRGKVYFVVNPQAPRQEWQRRPLPGAFVALTWTVTVAAPAHAITTCRCAELARTDDSGEYLMEGPNPFTALLADTSYYVYSAGLEPITFPYPGSTMSPKDITMTFSARTPESRLSHLSNFTPPGCPDTKLSDPRALLVPYLRALLDEAKTLKVDAPRGRIDVDHIDAMLRRAAGLDRPQGVRVVPLQGGIEGVAIPATSGPTVRTVPAASSRPAEPSR